MCKLLLCSCIFKKDDMGHGWASGGGQIFFLPVWKLLLPVCTYVLEELLTIHVIAIGLCTADRMCSQETYHSLYTLSLSEDLTMSPCFILTAILHYPYI